MENRQQNIVILIIIFIPFVITVIATLMAVPADRWTEVDRGVAKTGSDPVVWDKEVDQDGSQHWEAVSAKGKTGSIEVYVEYTGEAMAKSMIQLSSFADCAKVHDGDPVFHQAQLVNGKAVPWAFVKLSKAPRGVSFKIPAPRGLDQYGCVYVPHVLGLVKGQGLHVRNGDSTSHNINMQGFTDDDTKFNKVQGKGAPVFKLTFEVLTKKATKTSCQIHSWMGARIHVVEHPFFCTTDAQGKGKIMKLPAGTYTLSVAHESFNGKSQTVTVEAGKVKKVTFKVK